MRHSECGLPCCADNITKDIENFVQISICIQSSAFLYFFFPEVHQLIDWTKIPESLEKELKRITASARTKKRFADKLYKVWLLSGEEVWILIHIEIQSQYEENFPQRMYIYNYRAFDLYQSVRHMCLGGNSQNF